MTGRLSTIGGVVDAHLCSGCGVCAYLSPGTLAMRDVDHLGRRPLPVVAVTGRGAGRPGSGDRTGSGDGAGTTRKKTDAVAACPGRRLEHSAEELAGAPFGGTWGPVQALYECWATDPDLRHRGSSGGVVSALALHAVESGAAVGALQVRAHADEPYRNETVLSTSRDDVLAATGSRYAPASPCERLDLVEEAAGPCVVVGKPCDVAATRAATDLRPRLRENVGLTIGIFCAGTPSTAATRAVVRELGVDPEEVARVDYRGEGWPGLFRVRTRSGTTASTTYARAWGGTLTKNRQWRCMICPDHTGEFADLSVGDPWYRPVGDGEAGRSLVVVRTGRGHAALEKALADGALEGHPVPLERLRESQPHLEATRGAVLARIVTMRVAGLAAPTYRRLPSARLWWRLPLAAKRTSVLGTLKRVAVRRLWRPEGS